jgi:hypothetical protein
MAAIDNGFVSEPYMQLDCRNVFSDDGTTTPDNTDLKTAQA